MARRPPCYGVVKNYEATIPEAESKGYRFDGNERQPEGARMDIRSTTMLHKEEFLRSHAEIRKEDVKVERTAPSENK